MSRDSKQQDLSALPQGDLRLLESVVAKRLLASTSLARFAYIAKDGTPRVIPTWFYWTGEEIVMPTFISAPHIANPAARLKALGEKPDIAITIDTETVPPSSLLIRGRVSITQVDGIAPEYAESARRYLGAEAATGYLGQIDQPGTRMARIAVRPTWVGVLDFENRVPGVTRRRKE
jgi:hypothetical protein